MTNAPETYLIKSNDGMVVGSRATRRAADKLAWSYRSAYVVDTRSGTIVFDARPTPTSELPIPTPENPNG